MSDKSLSFSIACQKSKHYFECKMFKVTVHHLPNCHFFRFINFSNIVWINQTVWLFSTLILLINTFFLKKDVKNVSIQRCHNSSSASTSYMSWVIRFELLALFIVALKFCICSQHPWLRDPDPLNYVHF